MLSSRVDGTMIRDESPERRIMPFLMPRRNDCAVYHAATYDIGKARRWLRAYNRANPPQTATLFHMFLWACGQSLAAYPRMNRFVVGHRLYQRRSIEISFAAKRELSPEAPTFTVKVPTADGEPFAHTAARVAGSIRDGRHGQKRAVDRELALALWLPAFLLKLILWLWATLDRWGLLPRALIADDPMYASLFVANLGSVGLKNTFHHLYERGTVSMFAVLGPAEKSIVAGKSGPEVRESMDVRWTFDERITDGYYAAMSLRNVRSIMEDPERHIGAPEAVAAQATATATPERAEAA